MIVYFGYGSNLNRQSLESKGVHAHSAQKAMLKDWQVVFNVRHWFDHEGAMANIVPMKGGMVHGVLYSFDDQYLPALDAMEAYGIGYDRITLDVDLASGEKISAQTYVGLPEYLTENGKPTLRYLNIIVRGAKAMQLPSDYIDRLQSTEMFQVPDYSDFNQLNTDRFTGDVSDFSLYPHFTFLAGHVFDMTQARKDLHCVWPVFGGRDITALIARRHDKSTGQETAADYFSQQIHPEIRNYINAYLHEFKKEFVYLGTYNSSAALVDLQEQNRRNNSIHIKPESA